MTIEIRDLTKTYPDGTDALRGVSLAHRSGVLGIIGPNGAGKTTLLRVLATQLEQSSGSLNLLGSADPRDFRSLRRRIGYVPQDIRAVDDLTVRENLEYFYDLRRVHKPSRSRWIDDHLELTGLEDRAGARAGTLSGGERRKLGIALGIIHRPELLICDEVTTALDPGERVFFRNLLAEIGTHTCTVFSTHILEDIHAVADRLCVLLDGRVAFDGRARELIEIQGASVWQVDVAFSETQSWENRYLVTDKLAIDGTCRLKLISASPPPGAVPAPCRLEDAFLALLPRERRDEFRAPS